MSRLLLIALLGLAAVSYAQPFDGYLSLDGDNDYANLNASVLPDASDFTVEFWFRTCGMSGFLFDSRSGASGDGLEFEVTASNEVALRIQGISGSIDTAFNLTMYPHAWYHAAIVHRTATAENEFYFDGKPIGNFVHDFSSHNAYTVGRADASASAYFDGWIDEMRVSNSARYSGPFNPNGPFVDDAETLALWHFDDATSASLFADASASGLDLDAHMGAHTNSPFAVGGSGAVCVGASLPLSATGGPFYSWSPTTGLDDPTSPTPIASPENTTFYSVTVSDSNSCFWQGLAVVEIRPEPAALAETADDLICEGETTQLFASGGTSYWWESISSNLQSPFVSPLTTTDYTVEVTDAFGCQGEATVQVKVEQCSTSTAIDELQFSTMQIGPNPSPGQFWLRWHQDAPSTAGVHIYDLSGRLVHQIEAMPFAAGRQELRIETRLATGSYWLELHNEEGRSVQPFAVTR